VCKVKHAPKTCSTHAVRLGPGIEIRVRQGLLHPFGRRTCQCSLQPHLSMLPAAVALSCPAQLFPILLCLSILLCACPESCSARSYPALSLHPPLCLHCCLSCPESCTARSHLALCLCRPVSAPDHCEAFVCCVLSSQCSECLCRLRRRQF